MSYQDQANLASDPLFAHRLGAALANEAALKVDDQLADQVLRDPSGGVGMFMPLISTAPGFGDKYAATGQESIADGEMLAAIQANWTRVSDLYPVVTP